MPSTPTHWDKIFTSTEDPNLGWYEADPSQTLAFLDRVPNWADATIFLPGAGTSVLIDVLLERGATLILNDISGEALNRVKARLGDRGAGITWLCQDIAEPLPATLPPVDLWIDRAVLHFLTDEAAIQGYFENVKAALRPGGYALFAEFSLVGATHCAGLRLHRYSVEELTERMGPEFSLVHQTDYTYFNPSGDPRPYVYALFKR